MPSDRPSPRPKGLFRRTERVMVGAVMSVMAFFLEKIVMRGIKKEGGDPGSAERAGSTAIRTSGAEADLDEGR
jgi:hypothetical protein